MTNGDTGGTGGASGGGGAGSAGGASGSGSAGNGGAAGGGAGSGGAGSAANGSYATDIRPKFRDADITCMARRRIKLADATWMCDPAPTFSFADHGNARHVYDYLSTQRMPPDAPWPQDWLDTYQNWMTTGFLP